MERGCFEEDLEAVREGEAVEPEVVGLDIAFCDGAYVGGRGFAGKVDLLENGDRSEAKIGSGFSARHMELACQKRFE